MLIRILILFLSIQLNVEKCHFGCLKCSKSDECLVANGASQYYLVNGSAVRTNFACRIPIGDKDCLVCADSYYLDKNTLKCVDVTEQILNCFFYINS